MPAMLLILAVALAIAVVGKRGEVEALDPARGDSGSGSGSGSWSGASAAWGVPRVPGSAQAAADVAIGGGWFPPQPVSAAAKYNAIVSCADGWEALTGKRDPATWTRVFEEEAASPDVGSLVNAVSWARVSELRSAWLSCVNGPCSEKVRDARRTRYVDALDPWRRAGLMLLIRRGLYSEPGP